MKNISSNIGAIKKQFPIFKKNKDLIFFDNSSTTLKPTKVIEAISHYDTFVSANFHRGVYKNAQEVDIKYTETKQAIAKLINANSDNEIIFTPNSSFGLNQIAHSMRTFLKPGDEIITSMLEHSSSILPIFRVAKELGCIVKYLPENLINIKWDDVQKLISPKTKWISLIHASNVLGYINDVENIGYNISQLTQKIYYSIDATQSIAHCKIDVKKIKCDFLSFSAHKLFGPTGIGALYMTRNIQINTEPLLLGGGNNHIIEESGYYTLKDESPSKFEIGTINLSGIFGFHACVQFFESLNLKSINAYEMELHHYCLRKLQNMPNVMVYNPKADLPIIIFEVEKLFAEDVAMQLGTKNICVRAGQHCVKLLGDKLIPKSTIRLSLSIYNTKKEIDTFINALKNLGDCLDAFF
ncbi:hypothetical protein ASO20_00910 [Mycoplasma sp. (ex Biomphalaria glabrata)]|uniref:aminotransferase class V-fold PLP-dependent enzyme n=1 Tax=Mycoplasma sp. (ex Biomphalaria glabrata) TaxID=1749074 RepID=UPI00073AB29D|nr:aminotransferase class V-fold PLP-dependent enzyme [Mycoplasma sp. (ex Biomphalaria glabrata)]ALV23229.1 hypothetical protein ASO20_00910 [Mycoplasma sp. (ex Biomphalaria glabrata)]